MLLRHYSSSLVIASTLSDASDSSWITPQLMVTLIRTPYNVFLIRRWTSQTRFCHLLHRPQTVALWRVVSAAGSGLGDRRRL